MCAGRVSHLSKAVTMAADLLCLSAPRLLVIIDLRGGESWFSAVLVCQNGLQEVD